MVTARAKGRAVRRRTRGGATTGGRSAAEAAGTIGVVSASDGLITARAGVAHLQGVHARRTMGTMSGRGAHRAGAMGAMGAIRHRTTTRTTGGEAARRRRGSGSETTGSRRREVTAGITAGTIAGMEVTTVADAE